MFFPYGSLEDLFGTIKLIRIPFDALIFLAKLCPSPMIYLLKICDNDFVGKAISKNCVNMKRR